MPGGRLPAWFGAIVRHALVLGASVAAAGLLCGWPYWRDHPVAAAIALPCCGGIAVAGRVLAAGRLGRRTGLLLLACSAVWALTWSVSWNTGALPLVAVFAQSVFYLTGGLAVLMYPAGRLDLLAERLWAAGAALLLLGGQLALCLTSEPQWNGFAAAVIWPGWLADRAVFDAVLWVLAVLNVVLVGWVVIILVARMPRTGRLERSFTIPVAVAATVAAVAGVATQNSITVDIRLDDVLQVYLIQGIFGALVPLAFLGTGLRARLAELTVAERMLRLTHPVSVESVRDALRSVLHDDTLDLWFWMPADKHYVDVSGRRVDGSAGSPLLRAGRWRHEVRTQHGDPLATVEVAAALRDHTSLVEAALVAGGVALETAQLQATAQAHLERARAARERLVRVQAAERERLADDLQRSAQRRLHALEEMLARLETAVQAPAAREQARVCRAELAEAMAELNDLARGVHPAILRNAGLGPAMDLVARRSGSPVRLDIPVRRFPPEIESTLYFALCEALTNAVKHARADDIGVSVRTEQGRIVAEVADDGVGDARPAADGSGGLAGTIDRVRALRGTVDLDSRPGQGTKVTITIPFA